MLAKITILLGLSSVLCAMGGVFFANRGILPANMGLVLYVLGALIGLAAVVSATAALFLTTRYGAVMVGMMGALPLVAVVSAGISAVQFPRINDVMTNFERPVVFLEAGNLPANTGRDMEFPAAFIPIVQDRYAEVQPLTLGVNADTAYKRALEMARVTFGWTITLDDPEAHHFEAVATTRTFRWQDDIAVRVTPTGEMACTVDMRSKSRDGQSDFGVNAARIQHFLGELKALDN